MSDPVSEPVGAPVSEEIRIVKASPTDAELAAVLAVLTGLRSAPPATAPRHADLWGHPVDKLRYGVTSWQRVTLLERTHVRR